MISQRGGGEGEGGVRKVFAVRWIVFFLLKFNTKKTKGEKKEEE